MFLFLAYHHFDPQYIVDAFKAIEVRIERSREQVMAELEELAAQLADTSKYAPPYDFWLYDIPAADFRYEGKADSWETSCLRPFEEGFT